MVQLDRCRVEDVVFTPFGSIDFISGPLHLSRYRGLIGHLGRFEPYMPERVLRQFGRVQCKPTLGLIEPSTCMRPKKGGYELTFSEGHHWETRFEHLYDIFQHDPVVAVWDVDEEYYDWFEPRSHMYVSRDAVRHDPPVPHHPAPIADLVRRLQILTGILRELRRGHLPITLDVEQLDHMIEIATGDTPPVAPPPFRASQRDRAGPSGH